ncbi:glycerophosphodiester phosphodiesterase [Fonticella tunisiensis]|uniref:Glycerophosphoryl diester phosphodiesterase n=1 Tax=Fonticella tunisiensis TaxID=1096341 RepID=A0A4R7KPM3_9CLOT|nr:glycerophosphodiester phosphodiesterase [Fonticella tunisiensis]TDT60955.1 glycerophosphoryl diester phosphodiesterase [Fonticella tunisiensis]
MVVNYAHRGASGYYPENTMMAFEKAVEMGCTGIETDVHMTRDGVLVLIHDEMVNRTTNGIGFVKDYNYIDLSKLDAGSWFSGEFKGAKIPTVEELLLFAKDKDIIINFEIKSGVIQYENIEQKLIETIYEHNMENRVILSSFNHYSLVKCKKISGEIKTGILYSEGLYKPEQYAKMVGADALHPHFYTLNRDIVKRIKKEGILINTYTVNDVSYMRYFIELGIDGIITNYPDKLNKIISG